MLSLVPVQSPVAVAFVIEGLTMSMPIEVSVFLPGPDESFATCTAKVALVAVHAVRVKSTVTDNVAPSWVVENRIEFFSFT